MSSGAPFQVYFSVIRGQGVLGTGSIVQGRSPFKKTSGWGRGEKVAGKGSSGSQQRLEEHT